MRKIILIVMAMTALGQGAVALCLPSLPAIAHELMASTKLTKDIVSIFFLGFGISQLIYGPLSDRYGRKLILIIGLGIFILGATLSVFCENITQLLLTRLLQGLGAGALMVTGRSLLRDTHEGAAFTQVASYLSMAFALGFGLTPLIGGYLQQHVNWQVTFVFLALLGICVLFFVIYYLPETIQRKQNQHPLSIYLKLTFKQYRNIFTNITFLSYLFCGVFAYSIIITYSIMTPFLIQNYLHYSESAYGWLTVIIALFYFFGAYSNKYFVKTYGVITLMKLGLLIILLSGMLMLISTWFITLNIWVIMLPLAAATIGQTLIFSNCIAGALQDFPEIAGSAAALFSSLQIILAALISTTLTFIPEHNQGPIGIIITTLGILSASASYFIFQQIKKTSPSK